MTHAVSNNRRSSRRVATAWLLVLAVSGTALTVLRRAVFAAGRAPGARNRAGLSAALQLDRLDGLERLAGQGLWLVGGVLWLWLTASVAASVARRAIRPMRGLTWLDAATLPAVRKVLDHALVFGVAASTTFTINPSAASASMRATSNRGAVVVRGLVPPTSHAQITTTTGGLTAPTTSARTPASEPVELPPIVRGATADDSPGAARSQRAPHISPAPVPSQPTRAPHNHPQPGDKAGRRYVVVAGDNLWTIAKRIVEIRTPSPTNTDVAQYWAHLVATNRATLRSGNPSLIFPGEIVTLP